jgi:thioredoxin-related protein
MVLLSTTSLIHGQDWVTNLEEAETLAKEENKAVLLLFSGSDWCAPCIRLKKEILDTRYFIQSSQEYFVLLEADFPRSKKNQLEQSQVEHNEKLAEKYNTQGIFPLIVVLTNNGKVLGRIGYEKVTPELYLGKLKSFIR